jgi:hypothetical protein
VDLDAFAEKFPRLYHLALDGTRSSDSITEHGLQSTSALLELFEIEPGAVRVRGDWTARMTGSAGFLASREERIVRREVFEKEFRCNPIELIHPTWGTAIIRDHKMHRRKLEKALDGKVDVGDWIKLLNGKIFFFVDINACGTLRTAYSGRSQVMLVLDTRKLLAKYRPSAQLTTINTGATLHKPAKRGQKTFCDFVAFPTDDLKRIKEMTINHCVPDVIDYYAEPPRRFPSAS